MTNVYLMCGIPGSGKSTWVKNNVPNAKIVSRDIIRAEMGFTKNSDEKVQLSQKDEKLVTDMEYKKIQQYILDGYDIVIDDTNTSKYRKFLIHFLKTFTPIHIIGVNVKTTLENCIKNRNGQISETIMRNIYSRAKYIDMPEVDDLINVEW